MLFHDGSAVLFAEQVFPIGEYDFDDAIAFLRSFDPYLVFDIADRDTEAVEHYGLEASFQVAERAVRRAFPPWPRFDLSRRVDAVFQERDADSPGPEPRAVGFLAERGVTYSSRTR